VELTLLVFALKQTSTNAGDNDLVLMNVTQDDSGIYTCYAASTLGTVHKTAWLTVVLPEGTTLSLHLW